MPTLEQEFMARLFTHQVAIVGGTLMHQYIEQEKAKGGVQLPDEVLRDMADKYSDQEIQKAMKNGTFTALYNKIWNELKDQIPDNTKVTQS